MRTYTVTAAGTDPDATHWRKNADGTHMLWRIRLYDETGFHRFTRWANFPETVNDIVAMWENGDL